jgi:hypothetical protein
VARSIVVLLATGVLTAAAGGPGGLAWAAVAPRTLVAVAGRGAADVVNPETPAFIAADGWFCIVGVVGGLLCGLAGYAAVVRHRGAPAAVALIVGAVGASLAAWWIGQNIGLPGFRAGLMAGHGGAVLHAPLTLRAHSALASWPFGASVGVMAAELVTGRRDRRRQAAGTRPAGGGPP